MILIVERPQNSDVTGRPVLIDRDAEGCRLEGPKQDEGTAGRYDRRRDIAIGQRCLLAALIW